MTFVPTTKSMIEYIEPFSCCLLRMNGMYGRGMVISEQNIPYYYVDENPVHIPQYY